MSWRNIYLSKEVQKQDILESLSRLFDVKPYAIQLFDGEPDLSQTAKDTLVACGIHRMQGQFPMLLEVTLVRSELLPKNDYATVGTLCEYLQCSAVITNGGLNPYKWVLVRDSKEFQYVMLDSELLNKEDEFEISIKEYLEKFEV